MKPLGFVNFHSATKFEGIPNSRDDSVRVVNIISGEVGTNILQKDSNRKLPASSLYISLQDDFAAHVRRIPGLWSRNMSCTYLTLIIARSNHNTRGLRLRSCAGSHQEGAKCVVLVRRPNFHRALVRRTFTTDILGMH